MNNDYERSMEQKSFLIDTQRFKMLPNEISHHTRYKELDRLLSEKGGFELGRSYLITALGHHSSLDILRELFLGSALETILHVSFYTNGLIANNEKCETMVLNEAFTFDITHRDLIAFLEAHPEKKLVLVNQFDEFLPPGYGEEDLRFSIRHLRTWCNQNDRTLVVFAPLGEDAEKLAKTYPVAWPTAVFNGGYYKWSKMLAMEFDTEVLVNPFFYAVEFYRGKHRPAFQSQGPSSILIERNFVKDILELGEWQST